MSPAVPGTPRSGWQRRDAELARRTAELVAEACELLDRPAPDPATNGNAARSAHAAIAALTATCAERLRDTPGHREVATKICRLASDLQRLGIELSEQEMAGRTRRLAACEQGLARLRAVTSSSELVDRVTEEVNRSCGFGRTLLSRVDVGEGEWRPWMLHERQTTVDWFGPWRDRVIALDELTLETQLLTECRPALIDDVTVPTVHPMVHEGHANSYVVAPIMPAGRIIGFFHSDHHPTERRCDAEDREVLWAFAEGFGHLYERTVMLERLREQREQVRETLAGVDGTMQQLAEAEVELALHAGAGTPMTRTAFSVVKSLTGNVDELTPREIEVLELIVGGATNHQIAAELVITVGTVKSHVKHILAKLGAVNRSQAIARYLGVSEGWDGER